MSDASKKRKIPIKYGLVATAIVLVCVALVVLLWKNGNGNETMEDNQMRITQLKVNSLSAPVGIDTRPRFSWINEMSGYARSQSAYRIVVSSTKDGAQAQEGDLWDSGKVESGICYEVLYAGEELSSRTEYFYVVECWDERGRSVKSEVSSFETGILEDSEWIGKWIGIVDGDTVACDVDLSGANWIWYKGGASSAASGTDYFRAHFKIDEKKTVDEVLMAASMDDYGFVFVNCASVLRVKNENNAWKTGNVVNITPYVQKGDNVLGSRVINTGSSAGFICKIEVRYTDGTVDTTVTDRTWKCSNSVGSTSGWERENVDESKWALPDQVLSYGSSPWNTNVSMPKTMQVNVGASAPMLRKSFDLAKDIAKARIYVSGLGLYELYVNGTLPDDTVLNPAHTQYDDTVHYRVYDVTKMLSRGKNVLAVELGNYFYNCDFYTWMNWTNASYRDEPKLLCELHIEYADGSGETIVSDESWRGYEYGPTTYNNVYKGEHYDARLEVDGWTGTSFDDSSWRGVRIASAPDGELVFETMDPMRRLKTFTPTVADLGGGTYVVKTPVMTSGWARIRLRAEKGTSITITYAEKVDPMGYVELPSNGYPLQVDKFITSGGDDIYEPKFSYKGYEYIQIEGYPGELCAEDIKCYLVANDVPSVSSFECGDERVNYMHEMMLRTMINNIQSKITDTPVYEKNGWTGDFNFAIEAFNHNLDIANLTAKVLRDMKDTTNQKGVVNQIAPSASNGGSSIPIWSSIFIDGYYENWRTYGRFSDIEENYDSMRKQTLDYISVIRENGWVWVTGSYADWVSPNPSGVFTSGKTTHAPEGAGIIGSAYVYRTLGQMAQMADMLGKRDHAAEYRSAMEKIYSAFNERFYDESRGCYDTGYWNPTYDAGRTKYRQTSNIVPLMFGLCPKEYEQSVVESIVRDIKEKGNHLDVGAVGTRYILPMLSEYGYSELCMDLIRQDTYPSWGYWIELGATTCWETYESNARSRDHFFLGTYTVWFYQYLAGVRDHTRGYDTVTLKPEIHPELGYVSYSLDTVRGRLSSAWRFTDDGKLVWDVVIPVGTTARVYLPAECDYSSYSVITLDGDSILVPSGSYSFEMDGSAFATDTSMLRKELEDARSIDSELYTKQTRTALMSAISEGEYVLSRFDASHVEIRKAADNLILAREALVVDGVRARLADLVDSAGTLRAENFDYGALSQVNEALAEARIILSDETADETRLHSSYERLSSEMTAISAKSHGNLARGRTSVASSSVESAAWGIDKLTDGDRFNLRGSGEMCGWSSSSMNTKDHREAVIIDLGAIYGVNRISIMPAGTSSGALAYAFPRKFSLSVSADGVKWTTVASEEDYPVPIASLITFDFSLADARYVKLEGSSLRPKPTDANRFRMQIAEIEVYRA